MLNEFVAGTIGGIAQVVVGYPMDTVKVRMQTSTTNRSAWQTVSTLIQKDSWMALYRGMASPMAGIGFCNALVFMANGTFNRVLGPNHEVLAGACSGGVVASLNTPIELLKIRCQADTTKYRGIMDCGRRTLVEEGIRGLYRGLTITVIRDIPSFAGYFWTYETTKKLLTPANKETSTAALLTAGGAAGIAAWLTCLPQDIIKSRIQQSNVQQSMKDVFWQVYRQGGWLAFYKGLTPALVRAVPANAATFLAYEVTMGWLQSR